MAPTKEGKLSDEEMKATPALKTVAMTTVETLESSSAKFSGENVMISSFSSVPDKKSVAITTAHLVTLITPQIKYVDYKSDHPPTHPGKTAAQRDQDWQVSVYVVCILIFGMVVFVSIMLIKSNRKTRLVVWKHKKNIFSQV